MQLPITFHSLVLEITSRCTASCGMCYQSAGPKGSDLIGDTKIPLTDIKRIISEATTIAQLGKRCHVAGGEAFTNVTNVTEIFRHARSTGFFEEISTTTNGYWANTRRRAQTVAKGVAEAGLTLTELSWDHWHGPYISAHTIGNCIEALADNGVEVHLRVLTTKSHGAWAALEKIPPRAIDRVSAVHIGPVFRTGRAVELGDDIHTPSQTNQNPVSGTCHSMLNLTVNARGDVFPCCAGVDQTSGIAFWNVKQGSLTAIAEAMQSSLLHRVLLFQGPEVVARTLRELGEEVPTSQNNMCELCVDIFSDPKLAARIEQHFDSKAQNLMLEQLALNLPMIASFATQSADRV